MSTITTHGVAEMHAFELTAHCPAPMAVEITSRHHTFLIDEPVSIGGQDLAPAPLEMFLGALLGTTNAVARLIAREMSIDLSIISMRLTGHLDMRGVLALTAVKVPFPALQLAIHVETKASQAQIDMLRAALAQRDPMATVMREAGSALVDTWTITYPPL